MDERQEALALQHEERIKELEAELAELRAAQQRRPLSHGTRPLTERLHNKPLLVSWDPDSKCMVVSTMSDFFTHGVATALSLWDLLVEYHDHEELVYERETGVKKVWVPSVDDQAKWLKENKKPSDLPTLDDLDLGV